MTSIAGIYDPTVVTSAGEQCRFTMGLDTTHQNCTLQEGG